MYLHFNGTATGKSDPLTPRDQQVDVWYPEKPTDLSTVQLVISDSYSDSTELFHKIYELKGGITWHGLHIPTPTIGVDVYYKGTIEVYKLKTL